MARKVFISVLGATNYKECQYVDTRSNFKSSNTRFIQVAMFEKFITNWSSDDIAFIFLTTGNRGSEKKNWLDDGHFKYDSDEVIPSVGLQKLLEGLKPPCKIKPVQIKNGDNEAEIWENFRVIFNCLQQGDEVYFDVTHGFRSLPMLVLILNNYSKFLKNIKVASISYGNYEAKSENNEAPIINLTPLSELQDWTAAANMFISTGKTNSISALLESENVGSLNTFVDEINECRGMDIYSGQSALKLKNDLSKINISNHSFKELLEKIERKVENFASNDILNGFRAVDFCIQHQLIQQGVTLLQEYIISWVLKDIGEENWLNELERNTVSGCMQINRLNKFKSHGKSEDEQSKSIKIAQKVFSLSYKKKLSDNVFIKLAHGARNDLNHAGKRIDPKRTGYFEDKLKCYFKNSLDLLSIKL